MKIFKSGADALDMFFWFDDEGNADIVTKEEFDKLQEEDRRKKEARLNVDVEGYVD